MSVTNVTCKIGEKEIKFETGKLALQAPGAVVVTSGETNVLVTTVANETVREGIDFFPLTVDVEERMYSAVLEMCFQCQKQRNHIFKMFYQKEI